MKCIFCKFKDIKKIRNIKSPYFNLYFSLYECKNCKCRFFDKYQYKVSIDDMYEHLAKKKKVFSVEFRQSTYWIDQKKLLLKYMDKKPSSILDIGCRTGDFLMHFDDSIIREGVELSPHYANIAKQRGLKIYNDFVENINFNQNYDIVSVYAILEHLIEPLKFLDKINLLVNQGGIFIILIPTFECLVEKLYSMINHRWHMYSPPEHLNFFSKKFLDKYLMKKEFILIKRYYTSGNLYNPFKRIRLINRLFSRVIYFYDKLIFNKIPIFDHMYCLYKKVKNNK